MSSPHSITGTGSTGNSYSPPPAPLPLLQYPPPFFPSFFPPYPYPPQFNHGALPPPPPFHGHEDRQCVPRSNKASAGYARARTISIHPRTQLKATNNYSKEDLYLELICARIYF